MHINRYLPFALLYFFFNAVGLPFGLTWMALLAPFFYGWVLYVRKKDVLLPFLGILFPFIAVHLLYVGVDEQVYAVSLANIIMVYLFGQAFYTFITRAKDPEYIFRVLLVLNFVACIIGIIFYFSPWSSLFWITQELTQGITDFRRFRLFTYEASYYATVFVPVFFFFLYQYFLRQNRIRSGWLLTMIFLPLVISFSIGVIGGILAAFGVTVLFYSRRLLTRKRVFNAVLNSGLILVAGFGIAWTFFRNNPLFIRVLNIFSGSDTSANGRTADSFILARRMLETKSEWWGIGPGQVKLIGHDIINSYYLYNKEFVATIPNAMAEMLAVFGWWGLIGKLSIELGLFLFTRVWSNYYRLSLFIFMFIYQFTGSFITNLAEYVIWILAFTPVFRQFDVRGRSSLTLLRPPVVE